MCSTWCSFCGSQGDVLTVGDRDCLYVFYMVHLVFRIQLAHLCNSQHSLYQIRLCPIFWLCQIIFSSPVMSNSLMSNFLVMSN